MLSRPAIHSKNPKKPVTREPQMKTLIFHSLLALNSKILAGSPRSNTNGATRIAEPAFVQYASWMVELLQKGREDLIKTV
jgi:hypothetical protein